MALTNKLSAIGNAIRAKTGKSDLLTLDQMPTEIASIISGGGGVPETALQITGNCQYRFANSGWDWFIKDYGSQVTTKNITNCGYMFYNTALTDIPFDINGSNLANFNYMFYGSSALVGVPKIRGVAANGAFDCSSMFGSCSKIRDLEDIFSIEELSALQSQKVTSQYSCPRPAQLGQLNSLRTVPTWFNYQRFSEESISYPAASYCLYYNAFQYDHSLDEITNLAVLRCNAEQTSNMFSSTFYHCARAKNVTFETKEDGSPYVTKWKNQVIDLSTRVGWAANYSDVVSSWGRNNGITDAKYVSNDEQYAALKDDPDWFTISEEYARYNHDSAVATINSLPDTSAYLATAGGTNTIKFRSTQGSKTDGGAIRTLTEEEIAVAAAKGWTVTLA